MSADMCHQLDVPQSSPWRIYVQLGSILMPNIVGSLLECLLDILEHIMRREKVSE